MCSYVTDGREPHLVRSVFSIRLERVLVVDPQRWVLVLLPGNAVAGDQEVDVGSHKAAERVFRGADNRLAPDIEARVYQNRTAGTRLERREQRVIARVGLLVNGLDARRHIDMGYRRDFRADGIEPVDPKERLVLIRHLVAPILADIG